MRHRLLHRLVRSYQATPVTVHVLTITMAHIDSLVFRFMMRRLLMSRLWFDSCLAMTYLQTYCDTNTCYHGLLYGLVLLSATVSDGLPSCCRQVWTV